MPFEPTDLDLLQSDDCVVLKKQKSPTQGNKVTMSEINGAKMGKNGDRNVRYPGYCPAKSDVNLLYVIINNDCVLPLGG